MASSDSCVTCTGFEPSIPTVMICTPPKRFVGNVKRGTSSASTGDAMSSSIKTLRVQLTRDDFMAGTRISIVQGRFGTSAINRSPNCGRIMAVPHAPGRGSVYRSGQLPSNGIAIFQPADCPISGEGVPAQAARQFAELIG